MSHLPLIQVYEHSLLRKDERLTDAQWKSLGEYNQAHDNRFFTLQTNGIKFNLYVGVIQVGNQTIEVLPKIDRRESEENKSIWQRVLINMLRQCHWLDQHAHQQAPLRIRHRSILEAYLEVFLNHCEAILHRGLVKRYRKEEGNKYALKGKLLFAQNIRHNSHHAERFYIRHPIYDSQHLLNQILLKAIKLVPSLSTHSSLKDKVSRLLMDFPELPDVAVNAATFERIHYDRKTAHYQEAIDIAAMLLLHYRPDVRGGKQHVLAILFDMNELWEEYVFRKLKKVKSYIVLPQRKKIFWRPEEGRTFKIIKPDIVIESITKDDKGEAKKTTIIIDTKWKTPDGNKPADDDLKQMFAYNEYWSSNHAILLYPDKDFKDPLNFSKGGFCEQTDKTSHGCSMLRISVLNKSGTSLDSEIGNRLFDFLQKSKIV